MPILYLSITSSLHWLPKNKMPRKVRGLPHHLSRLVRNDSLIISEIDNFAAFELKLKLICNQGDEFGIRGFSLGIADGIAEKSLQSIQIPSVPGNLDGMADGTLHTGRRGLECFGHLGVQYLGDGVDHIHIVDSDVFIGLFIAVMLSCLLSCSYYSKNRNPAQVPCSTHTDFLFFVICEADQSASAFF